VEDIFPDPNTGDLEGISTDAETEAAIAAAVGGIDTDLAALQSAIDTLTTGLANINASQIVAGTLSYLRLGGTVAELQSVVYNRATLADPDHATDMWRWTYNAVRAFYVNEYGCGRARSPLQDQVAFRAMPHFSADGTSQAITQASLSNATTHLFQVLASGDILAAGGLSMLPSAPVGVSFNGTTATPATISDGGAGTGTPYALSTVYTPSDNRVWIDGAITNTSGVNITAQTTLFFITAAHRPASAWVQFTARTSTNLACKVTVKGSTGAVCLDQLLGPAVTVSFDGANYRKA
jgi:hypothetical protein